MLADFFESLTADRCDETDARRDFMSSQRAPTSIPNGRPELLVVRRGRRHDVRHDRLANQSVGFTAHPAIKDQGQV